MTVETNRNRLTFQFPILPQHQIKQMCCGSKGVPNADDQTTCSPVHRTSVFDNGEVKSVSLSDYKGKYLVLFFYPLDFTFVCPTEITNFAII